MLNGAELINDNGISAIALTFFTALFGAVSATVVGVFQLKAKANEAKDAAILASQEATKAKENTIGVSNGFTRGVDRKLDAILNTQADLSKAFRDHLEWHVENPPGKGENAVRGSGRGR